MGPQVSTQRLVRAGRLFEREVVPFVGEQRERAVSAERALLRQRSGLLVSIGELPCRDLARFHVGLIERVDADDRASHRGRDLPAEELLPEIVRFAERDAHDWVSRLLERIHRRVLRGVWRVVEPKVDEQPIGAVNIRRTERLAGRWGRSPCPACRSIRRGVAPATLRAATTPGLVMSVTLSRAALADVPRMTPSRTPGFCSGGTHDPHACAMIAARSRKRTYVETHDCGRHHTKVG